MSRGITDLGDLVTDHRRRLDILSGEVSEVQQIQNENIDFSQKTIRLVTDLKVKDDSDDIIAEKRNVSVNDLGDELVAKILNNENISALESQTVPQTSTNSDQIDLNGDLKITSTVDVDDASNIDKINVRLSSNDSIQTYDVDISS
jgi:hypothetical protein